MRKVQKDQAENYLKLLERAHAEIEGEIRARRSDTAMDLLGQCQEGAIELGKMIEAEEGEGFVTIPILESYCEQAYGVYEAARRREYKKASQGCKGLREGLARIRNSVRDDIKARMEAVFLPYKISMWDSMEKVWRAVDQAPDWDTYVIPIPYYDKKPDGSFGGMHEESDRYPASVPIVKYGEFDFAVHRPDVIFIQNPYDECSDETSVHPFFYSGNLKQYTEKLIYLPCLGPEEEILELDGTLPGVLHADRVCVPSERAAAVCREKLGRFMDEKELERKIVKFDSL